MPSTTPALYIPGSQKHVMVLDHQHHFLISLDHPLKDEIARVVLVSNLSQMETLHMNGHRCNTSNLVQRIGAHMMTSTNLEKGDLLAHNDKTTTPPRDVEEKRIEGKTCYYIPRHQVNSLTLEVLSDIQKNHRATGLKRIVRRLTNDAILMAPTDLEKGCMQASKDEATTPPYNDDQKRVGRDRHIYLPHHEADALMLTQGVLCDIQDDHRAARMKRMERQVRMDAIVILILKTLMVLSILACFLVLDWRLAFRFREE